MAIRLQPAVRRKGGGGEETLRGRKQKSLAVQLNCHKNGKHREIGYPIHIHIHPLTDVGLLDCGSSLSCIWVSARLENRSSWIATMVAIATWQLLSTCQLRLCSFSPQTNLRYFPWFSEKRLLLSNNLVRFKFRYISLLVILPFAVEFRCLAFSDIVNRPGKWMLYHLSKSGHRLCSSKAIFDRF